MLPPIAAQGQRAPQRRGRPVPIRTALPGRGCRPACPAAARRGALPGSG